MLLILTPRCDGLAIGPALHSNLVLNCQGLGSTPPAIHMIVLPLRPVSLVALDVIIKTHVPCRLMFIISQSYAGVKAKSR